MVQRDWFCQLLDIENTEHSQQTGEGIVESADRSRVRSKLGQLADKVKENLWLRCFALGQICTD